MKERKQFTKEFKHGAVSLVTQQGRSISDAASSLGIPAWSLSRWVKVANNDGQVKGNRTAQQQEIFELRQKVKQLEEEKDILKKRRAILPLTSGKVWLYQRA